MPFATWQAADGCTGSASAGARALMKWSLAEFEDDGARSLGIYNCRSVRGADDTSMHAEGRADDIGFPMVKGKANPAGHRLVQLLRPRAKLLGIQAIIFDRRIWSAKSPGRKGRYYAGAAPHRDHVHIELTRKAADKLTVATIRHVVAIGARTLRPGDRGHDVEFLQKALRVTADGIFGPDTLRAVRAYRARHDMTPDDAVGPHMWARILAGA